MTILSAQSIRKLSGLITPFNERGIFKGVSYGLSCCGYDIRIDQSLVLHPGDFELASSIEHFCMPANVAAEVKDKSTFARLGLAVQNTIIEPGWRGYLTLELSNHNKKSMWGRSNVINIERGTPIAQVVFKWLDEPTELPYGKGKYQDQESGPQHARFE